MESISFDYRRGWEEDTEEQIPKLCNEAEPDEVPEEIKENKKTIRKLSQIKNKKV